MSAIIKYIFEYGALVFAFGLMAPLIAQTLVAFGIIGIFGLSPLFIGCLIAGLYGLFAQIKGRWI